MSERDVEKRIERSRLPDTKRKLLLENIDHIPNADAAKLYPNQVRDKEFDGDVCMTKKRCCDIDWTGHGAYRSELRDRNPNQVNEEACKFIFDRHFNPEKKKKKPPTRDTVKFKGRRGPIVMDYDARETPAKVNIVTTYPVKASVEKIAKRILSSAGATVSPSYFFKLNGTLSGNHFDTSSQAKSFINKLQSLGADVVIGGVRSEEWRIEQEGGPYADVVYVTPKQRDTQNTDTLLKLILKEKPDELSFLGKQIRLWWD